MELKECVQGRRSIRKFKSEAVDEALIEKIVGVATLSPSWKNSQTTRFIVISNAELKKDLADK